MVTVKGFSILSSLWVWAGMAVQQQVLNHFSSQREAAAVGAPSGQHSDSGREGGIQGGRSSHEGLLG